jgi:hypothetical protein
MRGKILLVIALYLILGVIGFFNFGVYDYLSERSGWRSSPQNSTWKRLSGDVRNLRGVVTQEQEDELSKDLSDREESD